MDNERMKANRERLEREIDQTINKELDRYQSIMITEHTPEILLSVGLKDYPILMSQNHVRNCLHPKGKSARWHGLSKQYLVNMESYLSEPAMIYDSLTGDNSIVVATGEVDSDNLPIIISIRANGEGQYEFNVVSSNYLTSTYGHEHFAGILDRAIAGDDVLYVNKEKTQNLESFAKLQLLGKFSSDFEFNKIIHQSQNIVNEADEKNTQGLSDMAQLQLLYGSPQLGYNGIIHQSQGTVNENDKTLISFMDSLYGVGFTVLKHNKPLSLDQFLDMYGNGKDAIVCRLDQLDGIVEKRMAAFSKGM